MKVQQDHKSWQLKIECAAEKANEIEPILKQLIAMLVQSGATCQLTEADSQHDPQSRMEVTSWEASPDNIEKVADHMRRQGMPKELIQRQQVLMRANMGVDSWQAVLAEYEQQIATHKGREPSMEQISLLIETIQHALNAGEREKAKGYFEQAEQLLKTADFPTMLSNAEHPIPPQAAERIKQQMHRQLEKMRNWLT